MTPRKPRKKPAPTPEQVLFQALAHPLRVKVVEAFLAEDTSPKDVADALEVSLSNVSYHVRVLVDCGYLELIDKRQVRGAMQHFYRLELGSPEAMEERDGRWRCEPAIPLSPLLRTGSPRSAGYRA